MLLLLACGVDEVVGGRMMVPAAREIQAERLSQQAEGSGPQQNLMALVAPSKLAGQGTRAISVSFWSATEVSWWWWWWCWEAVLRERTVASWADLVAGASPVLVGASLLGHEVVRPRADAEAVGETGIALVAAPCRCTRVCCSRRETRLQVRVLFPQRIVACCLSYSAADEQNGVA